MIVITTLRTEERTNFSISFHIKLSDETFANYFTLLLLIAVVKVSMKNL